MNVETRPALLGRCTCPPGFPILRQKVRGKPLVFLDSAASAQKPRAVIDAMRTMETQYANVHRGLHWMSERTTDAWEAARDAVAALMNAHDRHEIVFVRNSTEAINLVAHSYGRGVMRPGQAVLISTWSTTPISCPGSCCATNAASNCASPRSPMPVSWTWRPSRRCWPTARLGWSRSRICRTCSALTRRPSASPASPTRTGRKVLFDGSQAIVHRQVDVQAIDADFYAWTGHKLYGPTGIGVLWARRELLDRMPPFMGGGEMITSVTYERSTWAEIPHKFEAGTPAIIEGIGLKAAIDYVNPSATRPLPRMNPR